MKTVIYLVLSLSVVALFVLGCTESPTAVEQQGIGTITSAAKRSGPATATGFVGRYNAAYNNYQYVKFDAHEAYPKHSAKGNITITYKHDPADLVPFRTIRLTVKYVDVDATTHYAWFAGQCTSDTSGGYVGQWLYIKVYDGDTSGGGGDLMWWEWFGTEGAAQSAVTGHASPADQFVVETGNLYVHAAEPQ
jgi:hypothetical protein